MSHHFSRTLDSDFGAAVERKTAALEETGFGIVTEISGRKPHPRSWPT
jgi:hypothetical protein